MSIKHVVVSGLALMSASAFAGDAATIISEADEAMNRAKDQIIDWKVVNQEPGKSDPKIMAFTSTVQGGKALTSFSAPADLKGTRVLVLGRQQMYIYLPDYGKVRRVASHTTQQGFMGTTFSFDDMNTSKFGDIYDAKLVSEEGDKATLELISKGEAPYAKAMVVIDTTMDHPLQMKYFNDKGQHVKTETRSKYDCNDAHNVCLPGVMRMEDHTRDGAWTELQRTSWELNTGVSDDVFTTRNLQLGE